MQVRIITSDNNNRYKLLGYYNSKTYDVDMKMFHYMRDNEITLDLNTTGVADTDGEEYVIESVQFVAPSSKVDELQPCVLVYVE